MRQTFGESDLARGADFAAQHLARPLGLDLLRPDRLQRDLHPQLQVEGAEHLAHAATAQDLADLVPLAQDPPGRGPVDGQRLGIRAAVILRGGRGRLLQRQAQQALRAQPRKPGLRRARSRSPGNGRMLTVGCQGGPCLSRHSGTFRLAVQ